jgi:hypothetical protein
VILAGALYPYHILSRVSLKANIKVPRKVLKGGRVEGERATTNNQAWGMSAINFNLPLRSPFKQMTEQSYLATDFS